MMNKVTIIGGGIMGLTFASLVNEIYPSFRIYLFEKLDDIGKESSGAFNNAGTGHAGYCELNYTPKKNGFIDCQKAIEINQMFDNSLEYWAFLEKKYSFFKCSKFISKVPHISFVEGEENVNFLEERFAKLKKTPQFKEMEFTKSREIIRSWSPLLAIDEDKNKIYAATKIDHGTDIDFKNLSCLLLQILKKNKNFKIYKKNEVIDINDIYSNTKIITFNKNNKKQYMKTNYVFIGAGGNSIPLLHKIKLPEAHGYAGFPISGSWLICNDPKTINQHRAKVYGQAFKNAPPMSIPHLDLRTINGKKILLFGPFAGFSLKFMKFGSFIDLPKSINFNNLFLLISVCLKNLSLLKYLIIQSFMTHNLRMKQLRFFYKNANNRDWKVLKAGKRVQIIKKNIYEGSKIEFGTEIIFSKDRSIAALIGASPGASISVNAMINSLVGMFGNSAKVKLKKVITSFEANYFHSEEKLNKFRSKIYKQLNLW